MKSNGTLKQVRRLVGDVSSAQLQHVDYAVSDRLGIFLPVTGRCGYASQPEHTHPAYSFILHFDNHCRVVVDSKVRYGQAGHLSACSPGVPHQELPGEDTPRYAAILAAASLFDAVAREHAALPQREFRCEQYPSTPEILSSVRELLLEHEAALPGHPSVIAACELQLLHLIVRQLSGVTRTSHGGARVTQRMGIDAAVEHLHAHFADSHTVRELARVAALSPSHFAREFKREMGLSPMDYLHRLRLDYARQQLLRSDATLTEIALASGFGSSSYFSTSFARRFGLPPSEYRKSYGGSAAR